MKWQDKVLISFDTMILIWATESGNKKSMRKSAQDIPDLQRRSRFLLDYIHEENHDVILPTIVASEYLRGVKPKRRNDALATLHELYTIAPFDSPAAAIAADLFDRAKPLPNNDSQSRTCMKADLMIVATAKAMKVARIYSHDANTRKLANLAGLEGLDLPLKGPNLFSGEQ